MGGWGVSLFWPAASITLSHEKLMQHSIIIYCLFFVQDEKEKTVEGKKEAASVKSEENGTSSPAASKGTSSPAAAKENLTGAAGAGNFIFSALLLLH